MEFRRITTSGRTILQIDGLRFLAIAAVLLYHIGDITDKYLKHSLPLPWPEKLVWLIVGKGFLGVQLFFMISGFVLALPFARQSVLDEEGARKPSLRAYYLRRLTRLEPPYVLTLLLYFALLVHHKTYSFHELLPHLWASLFYVHGMGFGESSWVNRSAWSLEVEVQFYLLAPLAARVFALPAPLCRRLLVLAVLVLSLLSAALFPLPQGSHLPALMEHAQFFATGFLLTDIYLRGGLRHAANLTTGTASGDSSPESNGREGSGDDANGGTIAPKKSGVPALPAWWLVPVLVLLCCLPWNWALMVSLPWYFLAIGIAAFQSARFSRFLSSGVVPIVGGMVYTIYLLHAQIISGVAQLVGEHGAGSGDFGRDCLLVSAISLPLVALASAGFFLLVERPCMNPRWPQLLAGRVAAKWRGTALGR